MEVGYDIYTDKRDFKETGITEDISKFKTVQKEYPCITLIGTPEKKLNMYKLQVVKCMLVSNDTDANKITIYTRVNDKTIRAGYVASCNIKRLISLFKDSNDMEVYLDKDKKLTGDMIYVLSTWR